MKTIQTKSGEILLVKVPELAFYFDWNYCKKNYDDFNNPRIQIYWETEDDRVGGIITNFKFAGEFEIVGKFSELKDEVFEEFVETHSSVDIGLVTPRFVKFYKYYETVLEYCYTSKVSFISLCKSQGIEDDLSNYLIVKKL